MNKKHASVTDFFSVIEPFGNRFMLTKTGSLLGAIELTGWDPDGLSADDHLGLSMVSRAIYGQLNRSISITQYYSHFEGVAVTLRDRADPLSHHLSKRREAYLNTKQLAASRIVHYLEWEPDENLNKLSLPHLLKHVTMASFDAQSRRIVANHLSATKSFFLQLEALKGIEARLQDTLAEVAAKWGSLFQARVLSQQAIWAHLRFLASLNPRTLDEALQEPIPRDNLDIYVTSGDIDNKQVARMDMLKLPGVTNTYARVASVRRFATKGGKLKPSLWAADLKAPVRQFGNYLLMTRWKPLTEFERSMMFTKKNQDLERAQLSIFDMMRGGEDRSELERQAGMKPHLKKMMEELGIAEGMADLWGTGDGYVVVFGEQPSKIKQTALALNQSASNAGLNLIWETVDIDRAFAALQPGHRHISARELYLTASQFGAASLIYQSSPGQLSVPDLDPERSGRSEEPQYYFQSRDGSLFGFSPFIGGRAMSIGVGPIRSGKTFAKNTTAAHFMKYHGALYRAIDIDPGSELLAHYFGDGRGLFRVGDGWTSGYNPFVNYRGEADTAFRAHFTRLALEMLQANDAAEDRVLTPLEQDQFDDALERTLSLKSRRPTLSHFVGHLPQGMRRKFARWVRAKAGDMTAANGRYAHLFDADVDAIGKLDSRVGVFNFAALRDDPKSLRPALLETLYRITQAFEDPQLRDVPKELDIDEAHYLLSIDEAAQYIVSKVRTWGKWFGSVHLWSQSPQEFRELKHWRAIQSAATTFWFMADPQMSVELYMDTFGLTRGQCEAIKTLVPKREAFIWQPEIGVSKVVVIDVEPEQRVFNTSHPREAALRDRLIAEHGFAEGMRRAVEALQSSDAQLSSESSPLTVAA